MVQSSTAGLSSSRSRVQSMMRSLENGNRILFSPPLATGSGPYGSNNISRTAPAVEGINLNEAQPVGRTDIPSQPFNE